MPDPESIDDAAAWALAVTLATPTDAMAYLALGLAWAQGEARTFLALVQKRLAMAYVFSAVG